MQSPGMVTFPALFTCFVATAARLSRAFMQSLFFSSVSPAIASASPPLVKTLPEAFMAFIALGAMTSTRARERGGQSE